MIASRAGPRGRPTPQPEIDGSGLMTDRLAQAEGNDGAYLESYKQREILKTHVEGLQRTAGLRFIDDKYNGQTVLLHSTLLLRESSEVKPRRY